MIDQSIQEVSARLWEETDYRNEAHSTRWFKVNLVLDGVTIPQVFDAFCTDKVITTGLLQGMHLDEWLESRPSQVVRDQAAQTLYDLFVYSTLELRRLHADPNPGNYLFKKNGELALIDFGCVKSLSDRFVAKLPALLRAFCSADLNNILSAYSDLGMKMKLDNEHGHGFDEVLLAFGEWLSMPFKHEYFDFGKHKNYTRSGHELIHNLSELPGVESVEKDFIFFDRTVYGLFKVFERLEAKVYVRRNWEAVWEV